MPLKAFHISFYPNLIILCVVSHFASSCAAGFYSCFVSWQINSAISLANLHD